MVFDVSYWTRVLRRILYVVLILIGLYLGLKLSIFYMPFLVAFIISLMIEPAIKYIMNKAKLTRRTSSIIIFVIVSVLILGTLTWLIITLFSESSRLLQGLNNYFDKAYIQFQKLISSFNFDKIKLSNEVLNVIQNSTTDVLTTASNWLRNALTGLVNVVTRIPSIAICIGITVLALYFNMCGQNLYIRPNRTSSSKSMGKKNKSTFKRFDRDIRRIFKSRSNFNISFFYYFSYWTIYTRINRI